MGHDCTKFSRVVSTDSSLDEFFGNDNGKVRFILTESEIEKLSELFFELLKVRNAMTQEINLRFVFMKCSPLSTSYYAFFRVGYDEKLGGLLSDDIRHRMGVIIIACLERCINTTRQEAQLEPGLTEFANQLKQYEIRPRTAATILSAVRPMLAEHLQRTHSCSGTTQRGCSDEYCQAWSRFYASLLTFLKL